MSGLPGSGLIGHLPGGKMLSNLLGGLQPPGVGGRGLQGAQIDPIGVRQMGDVDRLLGEAGTQVSDLLGGTIPGGGNAPIPAGPAVGPSAPVSWHSQGVSGSEGSPPWAHVSREGRSDFEGRNAQGDEGNGISRYGDAPSGGRSVGDWSPATGTHAADGEGIARGMPEPPATNGWAAQLDGVAEGVVRDATSVLGLTGRPVDIQGTLFQSGKSAFMEEQIPQGAVARSLARDGMGHAPSDNRIAVGDEAIPVDRQVTTQRPDAPLQVTRTETGAEVIEWRPDGNPVERQGGQQNQVDPRMGWMNPIDQGALLKLSLTVIPPVLREGEMTQSATRTALFRAVVNGQQAFIDSQGKIVGWAVRQDLPAAYVAEVIHGQELMQLPDGRSAFVDSQGRLRSLATGEVLRQIGAAQAARPGMEESSDADARALVERAEARFRELMWSTVLPSCIGLLLVVAAFLSAAAVGTMPVTVHAMFFLGAAGLAVFCFRTWKRWQRLPDGSVTKLPAITRRLRVMMALSCSAQGASAALLGIAVVLH